jgi:arylsulfatase A-like enzyme
VGRDRRGGVSLNEAFVGQDLKTAGYHTGMIGKWHLGEAAGYQPLDRGFDEFFGITAGASAFMTSSRRAMRPTRRAAPEGSYRTDRQRHAAG